MSSVQKKAHCYSTTPSGQRSIFFSRADLCARAAGACRSVRWRRRAMRRPRPGTCEARSRFSPARRSMDGWPHVDDPWRVRSRIGSLGERSGPFSRAKVRLRRPQPSCPSALRTVLFAAGHASQAPPVLTKPRVSARRPSTCHASPSPNLRRGPAGVSKTDMVGRLTSMG